ncbi:MAG: cytochrome C554 [Hyphomicrobiales bacterium]|nr:MAG: cytochrome C554 [Hyphomicrobiales bacterium]
MDINVKKLFQTSVFSVLALCVGLSFSHAVDIEVGKKLARKCSACHGKMGMARDPEVPNLAGQSSLYLAKAIDDFISGKREDRRMSLIVKRLSKEDVKNLAAWFASIKVEIVKP